MNPAVRNKDKLIGDALLMWKLFMRLLQWTLGLATRRLLPFSCCVADDKTANPK